MIDILFGAMFAVCGVALLAVAFGWVPPCFAEVVHDHEED